MNHLWAPRCISITTEDLTLRPLTEADAFEIAGVFPADVEQDPSARTYDLGLAANRAVVFLQAYWRSWGSWTPDEWALMFGVRLGDRLIGTQTLEGTDFGQLATVDTASMLLVEHRGQGLGKQMRRAVLTLAFGPLGAQAAISSAWDDNHASLGVSRAVGYCPNGVSAHADRGRAGLLRHLRMTREQWAAGGQAAGVTVTGCEPALPYFGLPTPPMP